MRRQNIFILLFVGYTSYLPVTGIINTAYAAQDNFKQELNDFLQHDLHQENDPDTISGKVSEMIAAGSVTYVEVDTGTAKFWSAGPVTDTLKIGDVISFSTTMPMQNFHSKTLGRDFSVLYFVNKYMTDKATSISPPSAHTNSQKETHTTTRPIAKKSGEVAVGSLLREASLDKLNGTHDSLSDYKGKPLIINVWASWCSPCKAEMGSLDRLAQRYNGKMFNIIGISTDDYRNNATALIRQTAISFENYLDKNLLMENMLGANTIPLTILVSAEGRVLKKVHGYHEWDSPESVDAIGKVFGIKLMR